MKLLLVPALLLTLACTTVPEEAAPPEPAGGCSTDPLGELVGRAASAELGGEALRRSGARALRWIRPGDMVTMDYRPDRLNVHLDASGQVERFACG